MPSLASDNSTPNCFRIPDVDLDIEFNNQSDALLSSFLLSHEQGTRLYIFDAFLKLLHNPVFQSTDISFERLEDIYAHIAEFRRTTTEKMLTPHATTPVPAVIVYLVADMLDSERLAFEELVSQIEDNLTRNPYVPCPEEAALRNMSLVHRSWTSAAQRALRRRQNVVGLKDLHKLLRNPHVGPWVRELSFTSPTLTHYWSGFEGLDDIAEVSRLLLVLLKLCPNVRKLYIKSCFNHKGDLSSFGSILQEIGSLPRLDTLWLTHYRAFYGTDDTPNLPDFCAQLPRMKALKRLSLNGWSTFPLRDRTSDAHLPESLDSLSPTANLKTLSFALPFHCDFQHTGLLSWILRPRKDFLLTSVDVSCRDLFTLSVQEPMQLFGALFPLLPHIKHLRLQACSFEIKPMEFIEKCVALKSLVLVYDDEITSERIPLPPTLRHLQIHFVRYPDRPQNQDENVVKTVSEAKHIESLSVTATRQRFPEHIENEDVLLADGARLVFPETKRFCEENSISFHTDVDIRLPSFFSGAYED